MEGIDCMKRLAIAGVVREDNSWELRRSALSLALALLALNILDLAVTSVNIKHFGATELNAMVAPLLGTPWAATLKIGIPVLTITLAARVTSSWIVTALRVAVVIYLVVVIFGVGQLAYALV